MKKLTGFTPNNNTLSLDGIISAAELQNLPVSKISLGTNVRMRELKINDPDLIELAESIRRDGQLQPVGIEGEPNQDGKFELVYGYRRYFAIVYILKRKTIHATFSNQEGKNRIVTQLVENIQREDLGDADIARSLQKLKGEMNATNAELAKFLSKSEDWIKSKLFHALALKEGAPAHLPTSIITETRNLDSEDRQALLLRASKDNLKRMDVRNAAKEKKEGSNKKIAKSPKKNLVNPREQIKSLNVQISNLKKEKSAAKKVYDNEIKRIDGIIGEIERQIKALKKSKK